MEFSRGARVNAALTLEYAQSSVVKKNSYSEYILNMNSIVLYSDIHEYEFHEFKFKYIYEY